LLKDVSLKIESQARLFSPELGSAAVGYFNPKYFEELVSSILEEDPDANLVLLDDFRILVVDK
jgi:hypothetical protein